LLRLRTPEAVLTLTFSNSNRTRDLLFAEEQAGASATRRQGASMFAEECPFNLGTNGSDEVPVRAANLLTGRGRVFDR
jgi:hypothetical protein